MQLRKAITKISGLAYMLDELDIQSSLARRCLLDTNFITDSNTIQQHLNRIEAISILLSKQELSDIISTIKLKLSQVRDIQGTITKLSNATTFDDVELFELKHFSLLSEEIRVLLVSANIDIIQIPNLNEIVSVLDPDKQKIAHFYIYDSYSKELTEIRKALALEKKAFNAIHENDIETIKTAENQIAKLYQQSVEIEDSIREEISRKLLPYKEQQAIALEAIASLDILIAKGLQVQKMKLTKPAISSQTMYKAVFNPSLKASLEAENKRYQSIDISFSNFPCLITGANMAGKTVLLKTIALAQYLFQFGFFVPASSANITIVENVFVCIDDEQNETKGLSSFAAEIISINTIIKSILSGNKILVLIDELARTTNPHEGRAIVNGMLDFLAEHQVQSLITTHYNGIIAPCKHLRIKGFIDKNNTAITKDNINNFIDYSLVEADKEELPMEALRIAEILLLEKDLLNKIHSYID